MKAYVMIVLYGNSVNQCHVFRDRDAAFDAAQAFADRHKLPFVAGMFWNDGDDSVEVIEREVEE